MPAPSGPGWGPPQPYRGSGSNARRGPAAPLSLSTHQHESRYRIDTPCQTGGKTLGNLTFLSILYRPESST